ncbi:hypothetical protein DFS34DRAFT_509727 [Phlyctochytrium arcticum]|nr:hypothetical protein DFS34DRAFT_509727 [Phlyctochytrium arcticum]
MPPTLQSQLVHPNHSRSNSEFSQQSSLNSNSAARFLAESPTAPAPTGPLPPTPASGIREWSESQVANWLSELGFERFAKDFIENSVNGDVLLELNYDTLKEIGVVSVGDRARILQAIKKQARGGLTRSIAINGSTTRPGSYAMRSPSPASAPPTLSSSPGRSYMWERQLGATTGIGKVPSPGPGGTPAGAPRSYDRPAPIHNDREHYTESSRGEKVHAPHPERALHPKPSLSIPENEMSGKVPKRKGSLTNAAAALERSASGPSPLIITPRSSSIKSATLERNRPPQTANSLTSASPGAGYMNTERSLGRDDQSPGSPFTELTRLGFSGNNHLDDDRKHTKEASNVSTSSGKVGFLRSFPSDKVELMTVRRAPKTL